MPMFPWQRTSWHQLGLPALVLLGLLLRLPYLTERSLWFDEACSWRTASFGLAEMLDHVRQNVHPPLYYLGVTVLPLRRNGYWCLGLCPLV